MTAAQGVRRAVWLLALACALLFAALALAVGVRQGAPLPGDGAVHTWALGHRPPVAEALARGITATGTGPWPYAIVVLAGIIAGRDTGERLRAAGCLLAVLLAGQLVRTGLMELFARARPDRADWATHASGFAFPSGHATSSALTAGLLCWAVTRHTRPDLARTTCALAVCWAAAVGLTRVYLGVHWASDVLGGWLLAAALLGSCSWALARWSPTRSPAAGSAPPTRSPAPGSASPTRSPALGSAPPTPAPSRTHAPPTHDRPGTGTSPARAPGDRAGMGTSPARAPGDSAGTGTPPARAAADPHTLSSRAAADPGGTDTSPARTAGGPARTDTSTDDDSPPGGSPGHP